MSEPVKEIFKITPYINIVEDKEGEKYAACSHCGHVYCKADENFKLYALIYDSDPEDVDRDYMAPDKEWMIYREFYCPGCGSQIEVEATASCIPILHNIELEL